MCRLRWRLPWGVRMSLAQLLLGGVLAAREGGSSDGGTEGTELEALLRERLWPALGISDAVHDALQPFMCFQGYVRTGGACSGTPLAAMSLL
jgi:hypothetical protein